MSEKPEFYYRLVDELVWDESAIRVDTLVFRVRRRTPKGAWIQLVNRAYGPNLTGMSLTYERRERFVLDGPGRRYAYPDMEAAIESYRIRKQRHVQHLESQLVRARAAMLWAETPNFMPGLQRHDESLHIFHSY